MPFPEEERNLYRVAMAVRKVKDVKDKRMQKFLLLSIKYVQAILDKAACLSNSVRDRFLHSHIISLNMRKNHVPKPTILD